MRSPENEQLIHAMWEDYEREGLPGILRWAAADALWLHRVEDGKVVWTASSPDLAGRLEEAGLERRLASHAYVELHREAA
jgi:hypothetical protein